MKDFTLIWNEARIAGLEAGMASKPTPMIVSESDLLTNQPIQGGQSWYVADGVCGFAWLHCKGNSEFGRWAKAKGLTHPGYPNGLDISIHEFGQSMQRKEACAGAMAKVLQAAGIKVYSMSRMD